MQSDTLLVAQSLLGYQLRVGGEELSLSKEKNLFNNFLLSYKSISEHV